MQFRAMDENGYDLVEKSPVLKMLYKPACDIMEFRLYTHQKVRLERLGRCSFRELNQRE